MLDLKKINKLPYFQIIGGYFTLLCFFLILYSLFVDNSILSIKNFINWDATHYHYIAQNKYSDFRIAFFPLYPKTWALLNANIYTGITINIIAYLISLYFLIKYFLLSKKQLILILTLPCSFFFILPYSEAFFCLFSILYLISLKEKNRTLSFISLFFCSLTRPIAPIFIIAIILTEIIHASNIKTKLKNILNQTSALILGLGVVAIIQYIDTNEWFKFFSAQSYWGNHLQIPKLPLSSWGGDQITLLDSSAFLIGIFSAIVCIVLLTKSIPRCKSITRKFSWLITNNKEIIFSLLYLAGITFSVLLFRGGKLFSLNRFIYATPYFFILIKWLSDQKFKIKSIHIAILILALNLFFLLSGSYNHIQGILKYFILSVHLLLFILSNSTIVKRSYFPILVLINFSIQIILFIHFLQNHWVA